MNEAAAPTFFPFIMLLVFFLFVYFVTIRPQQKRKKEHETLVSNLQKGDEVMTSSGLVGKVDMQKEFISSQLPKGTINSIESQ